MKALILACMATTLLCANPELMAAASQSATQQHQQSSMVVAVKSPSAQPVTQQPLVASVSHTAQTVPQAMRHMPFVVAPTQMKPASYMYVILADHGMIQPDAQGRWTLTLNKVDMKHIVKFSEQPLRMVQYVSPAMLAQQWTPDQKNFSIASPNAAVVINQHIQLVQLVAMHVQPDQVVYEIKAVHDPLYPLSGGPVSVFMM
jgi:hypothetical protein